MSLSVVITCRNEGALTDRTCREVLAKSEGAVECLLVEDGCESDHALPDGVQVLSRPQPHGVDAARHLGISAATQDTCLILDAHMTCSAGYDSAFVEFSARRPTWIGAGTMVACLPGEMEITPDKPRYHGARIEPMNHDEGYMGYSILQPKWLSAAPESGAVDGAHVIPCVLGASYVVNRAHYLEGLGGPWQHLRGWGWSEPWISLLNFCLGHESALLPVEMGHMMRSAEQQPSRTDGEGHPPRSSDVPPYRTCVADLAYNQAFLLHALPMHEELRRELAQYLGRSCGSFFDARTFEGEVAAAVTAAGPVRAWIEQRCVRNVNDYVERWAGTR